MAMQDLLILLIIQKATVAANLVIERTKGNKEDDDDGRRLSSRHISLNDSQVFNLNEDVRDQIQSEVLPSS